MLLFNPTERPTIDNVKKRLKKIQKKFTKQKDIDEDIWQMMNDHISSSAKVTVDERTQCSRNVALEIGKQMNDVWRGNPVTGGTDGHDQGVSNLCHSFAPTTALRKALRDLTDGRKSKEITVSRIPNSKKIIVHGGKTGMELMNDDSEWEEEYGFNVADLTPF